VTFANDRAGSADRRNAEAAGRPADVVRSDPTTASSSASPLKLLVTGLATYAIGVMLLAALLEFGIGLAGNLAQAMLGPSGDPAALEALFNVFIFGAMLLIAVVAGLVSGINPLALGRRKRIMLPLGLFAGLFGLSIATAYAGVVGSLQANGLGASSPWLFGGAVVILLQAGAEEVYFRGWLQPALARVWGIAPAVLCSALAFCILHVFGGARSPITLINLFLGGLLFGVLAAQGRGILGAVAAHFSWNATEQLVVGLDPNPGIGAFGTLLDFDLSGPAQWGGSEEGLNASLAMTVALALIIVPLVIAVRRRLTLED
jgi:membrane protease YdiL (CAAX protease family)